MGVDLIKWIKRGKQRRAVTMSLRKPMTGSEIWAEARVRAPRIELRDVWFLLRQMRDARLVECVNPGEVTGRLYRYTDLGREIVYQAFDIARAPPAGNIDWNTYARITRGKARKAVFCELGRDRLGPDTGLVPVRLRKNLLERKPLSKNVVLRVLCDLRAMGLVEVSGTTRKPVQKIYRLSNYGRKIHKLIRA